MTRIASLFAVSLLAVAACSTTGDATGAAAAGPSDGDTFRMAPGDAVTLAGEGTLRYERLANDSRCLPDVQCVWAGDAEVAFAWRPAPGVTDAFTLHTGRGDKSHRIGRHVLVLEGLARGDAPEAQLRLEAAP